MDSNKNRNSKSKTNTDTEVLPANSGKNQNDESKLVQTITILDDGKEAIQSSGEASRCSPEMIEQGTLTNFAVSESETKMIQIEYPGFVDNADKAVRTLGGMQQISSVVADPKKKLELRFRPGDLYCNPVLGESVPSSGILIKVRRRKKLNQRVTRKPTTGGVRQLYSDLDESKLLGLDYTLPEPPPQSENPAFICKPKPGAGESLGEDVDPLNAESVGIYAERERKRAMILEEEAAILEKLEARILDAERGAKPANEDKLKLLKLPTPEFRPSRSGLSVEVLGIIHQTYKFGGICDFQYLPTEFDDEEGCQVSVQDNIAPVFGDPDNNTLFMTDTAEPKDDIPLFLVPSVMTRLDKPLSFVANFLDECRDGGGEVIRSTRTKRIVYSHNINFRLTDGKLDSNEVLVPEEAVPEALLDVDKRMLREPLEAVKDAFAKRPIWTKNGLEAEIGIKRVILKFLVPCIAYYSLNGPWRSLWIRLGFDPRKNKSAFIYQVVDYRVPHFQKHIALMFAVPYRSLLSLSKGDPQACYSYKPGEIPPKTQMFFQICDIHIKEVDNLIEAVTTRLNSSKIVPYNAKSGFIDENTLEYCRYSINRYVEVFLKDEGKIPALTLPELEIPPGSITPTNMSKWGFSRNSSTSIRMRSRPKRKEALRRTLGSRGLSSSRNSESDASSLVGDLTIKGDLFRDSELVSLDDDEEDWQEPPHTPGSIVSTDENFDDDDDDPVSQEILGN